MVLTLDCPSGCYLQCFFHSLAGKKKRSSLQILRQHCLEPVSGLQILPQRGPKASFSQPGCQQPPWELT